MKKSPLWVALALISVLLIAPVHADERRIVEQITVSEMKDLLQAEGFADVEIHGDSNLVVRMNGLQVLALVRNGTVVQFRLYMPVEADLGVINEWNMTKMFTKAYLDRDGDPVLEMDVDLDGGITEARIRDAIRTFSLSQIAFMRELL